MASIGMDLSPPTQSLEDIHFPLKFTLRGKRKRTHSPRQQESESGESIGSNSEVESKMEEQCQNMSGGIVSVQAGPFDPKVESTFDLKRIATNYGFTMEELGALEHLFLENASYGNLFLKLGSDKEKFEFLSRQIDVFNRKYGGNDRRTAKRKSRHG
ncbi:uncharacterized protein LOC127107638 [Lathyrus oleraceus]|uniref:uncharacterized protein LOC127107638 n=1 Tax=Pisum sativum TaxID=3888 RepID=UPI0021D2808F|nr:uncharacterized protein LOC127107638 [Pisum sativum]